MIQLTPEMIALIVAGITALLSMVRSKYKKEYELATAKGKQANNLLDEVLEAAKDGKVTEEEFQRIASAVNVVRNS